MDMTRLVGIGAVLLGLVLLAFTWQNSTLVVNPLTAMIGGYARNTVLLGSAGVVALIAGCAAYMMGKTTIQF